LEDLEKGDLVLNTNKLSNSTSFCGIFLEYGLNAAYCQEKRLSKILLDNQVVQIPTAFLTKNLKRKNDTTL
tara:strand:- start:1086 stop:1298 length:213 start_codon:yes stop_codon:yes gene_type:complete